MTNRPGLTVFLAMIAAHVAGGLTFVVAGVVVAGYVLSSNPESSLPIVYSLSVMTYFAVKFVTGTRILKKSGKSQWHLIWIMALYLPGWLYLMHINMQADTTKQGAFMGDSSLRIYHALTCGTGVMAGKARPESAVRFRTRREAENAGYAACDLCSSAGRIVPGGV